MIKKRYAKSAFLGALFLLLTAVVAFAQLPSVKKHPFELTENPVCSQCHPDKYGDMSHTADWEARHKFPAQRAVQYCNICHQESYCADCHANKEELKPSDKYKGSPERFLPHRGDYLSQHKIDGKINPAACFRCHGRSNNKRCRVCHG